MLGLTGFGMWTQQEAEMDVLTPEAAVHAGNAWDMTHTTSHRDRHERGGEESVSYEAAARCRRRTVPIVQVGLWWPTRRAGGRVGCS